MQTKIRLYNTLRVHPGSIIGGEGVGLGEWLC